MKNLKKIFSVVLAIAMIFSFTTLAFAESAGDPFDTNYTVKAVASSDSIKVGEDVTISVYIAFTDSVAEDMFFTKALAPWGVELSYDNTVFEYKSHSTTYDLTETGNGGDKGTFFKYEAKMNNDITVSPSTAIFSVIFTAKSDLDSDALNNEFTISSLSITDATGNGPDIGCDVDNYTYVNASVDVTKGSTEPTYPTIDTEETFTAGENIGGITATNDTKAISVFAKATKALEANSYGIRVVSGGKTYVFRGIAPVAENGVWAIKVVSPDGTFSFKDGGTLSATSEYITTFED